MSTLKAARADNFYYPPDGADWTEQRRRMRKTPKRARNYFRGSAVQYADSASTEDVNHAGADLGDLAPFFRGSGRGAVIRFEMPFKVVCLKCEAFIAKGVRFDAERKAVGKYFSTTIYAFLMSCQLCHNPIVIQTDPENTDYLCKVGVRKKVETFDTSDAQTAELGHDHATQQQLLSNPLFRLECMALASEAADKGAGTVTDSAPRGSDAKLVNEESRGKAVRNVPVVPTVSHRQSARVVPPGDKGGAAPRVIDDRIDELLRINEVNNSDWYLANSALRKRFREEKKRLKPIPNFNLELVDENQKDVEEARKVTFLSQSKQIQAHFKRVIKKDSDIFSQTCASSRSGGSTLDDKRKKLQFIKHIDSRLRRRANRAT
ncbi:cell cycle control related protein, putative [Babesia caballi]|uniref:Cell cycle control related protein, putative n=1 Tax=Babesia caballi TaxID=5871 RepID=A0AAV4LZD8_BABCB|nr:cell cycle control related protein, putative [Babesia caballi]